MEKNNIFLSVIIPSYNEEENLKNGMLEKVYEYLIKQKYSWEVLVVDDGSLDKTAMLAEDFSKRHWGFEVLNKPHSGKGGTIIAGMLKARGEIVLFTDMDQATPINQLERVLPKFDEGFDVVIGSRAGREGAPILRKAMAFGFTVLRTLILRLPYKDTQCGFKAFTKAAVINIFRRLKIYNEKKKVEGAAVTAGFDLETIYIARKLGLKIAEVPVKWHHVGTERVNPIKDSWEGLKDLMAVRMNALKGKYDIKK